MNRIPNAQGAPRNRISTPGIHHFALGFFVVGAAAPYHLPSPVAAVSSISLLDITLCLEIPYVLLLLLHGQPARVARFTMLALSVPMFCCVLSLAWSYDYARTVKGAAGYCEASVAFGVAYALFSRLPPRQILLYTAAFVGLLVVPAFGSQWNLPWCEPQILDTVTRGSNEYNNLRASYDSRLSHPFIGMHNDFATVLSLFVLVLFAGASAFKSSILLFGGLTGLAACALTQSRGVLAALFLGAMGVLFTNRRHIWRRQRRMRAAVTVCFAATILVAALLLYGSYNDALVAHLGSRFTNEALIVRAQRLGIAADAMTVEPVTGFGGNVVPSATLGNLHNTYVEQIVYFGLILGPLTDLALLSIPFILWRYSRRGTAVPLVSSAVVWTVVAQLISFGGETSFEAYLPKTYVYLAIGLFVALLVSLRITCRVPYQVRRFPSSS